MRDALLSIVVPIYNAEKYLEQCIKSVLKIKDNRWQLILVDDGSTDSSSNICRYFSKIDNRILYHFQENSGVSVARNVGIEHATGTWITFLDADDTVSERVIEILNNTGIEVDMVVTRITRTENEFSFSENSKVLDGRELQKSILNLKGFLGDRPDIKSIGVYDRWSSCGRFYRLQKIQENGILFPRDVKLGEDLVFCMGFSKIARKVVVNESVTYFYRQNNESVTQRFHKDRVNNTRKIVEHVNVCTVDESLRDDVRLFVAGRIVHCCIDYFADKRNELTFKESKNSLKRLCEELYYQDAIENCKYRELAIGKKNQINSCITLFLLKRKQYALTIWCLRLIRRLWSVL